MKIPNFIRARISTGIYNTKGYRCKVYVLKHNLEKALKKRGCELSEISTYENWNHSGINYTLKMELY